MTLDIAAIAANLTTSLVTMATQNATAARQAALAVTAARVALANRQVARNSIHRAWFGKIASWAGTAGDGASLANKPLQSAKTAVVAALPVVDGPNPNDAGAGLQTAQDALKRVSARLASVADSAGHSAAYCTMMLAKSSITSSRFAKARTTEARKAAQGSKTAALWAQSAALDAGNALGDLIKALTQLPPPPPLPPVLSTLSVRALRASLPEGNDLDAAGALGFAVARAEPLDLACSVIWTATGTATLDDFVDGTSFTGTLAWDAGDGADKTLELVLVPDLVIEADEKLAVTLSEPQNAALGTASAVVSILDDDTPAPSEIGLPVWPAQYDGPTFYVAKSVPAGGELSRDRTNPGNAQNTLNSAPSGSTIVFTGSGPYPALTLLRNHDAHLKLVSEVPAFTDLQNLHPDTLSVADLDGLADEVVVGKNMQDSARLGNLLLKSGGYIWVEGFRSDFPSNWVVSSTSGGALGYSCAGVWFEKCRPFQGNGKCMQFGPQKDDGVNQLNVAHKCWVGSYNEIGDSKDGGGTWQSSAGAGGAGTAICDYGITSFQNTGQLNILECFFQMRANHFVSLKRGVGRNGTERNRIQGNLFAGWGHKPSRMQTLLELGQEHDESNRDFTTWAVDVLDNTFADPNSNPWFLKNCNRVTVRRNRVLMHQQLIRSGLAGGNRGTTVGPVHPGPNLIADNVIMDKGDPCQLASLGVETTVTFARNKTPAPISVDTFDAHLGAGAGNAGPHPRVTVVRTDGDASGFAAPKAR